MPITEVPTNSSGAPPEPPRDRRRARFDDLEPHELLNVIDDMRDDRARARLREIFWILVIVYMVFFWFIFYGQKYLYHPVLVRNPVQNKKDQMTYLELPRDALKQLKPKHPAPMSDKNRIAQSKQPTLDKKTLQELEAMRRAGPPTRVPAPLQPKPQPQQQAAEAPPPQPQPVRPSEQSKVEAPRPAPAKPSISEFKTPATPQEAMQQAMRQAQRPGAYPSGGDMGANAPVRHSGMAGAVDVLSDTLGVDFGPYLQRVIYDTKRAWYPIIPEEAQPPINKQGKLAIRFKILPDGSVKSMTLELPSGDVALDRAAWGGITGASPYPPLPKNFKGPFLELRFYFMYNIPPGNQ